MSISIVLLSYKEEKNLRILLPKIKREIEKCDKDYEILVVDAEKPLDNTKDICEKYDAKYINQEEPCFGGAFRTAIKYAEKDLFLIMDSDGSHHPKYIPEMYRMFIREQYDVVIGSRYTKGGVSHDAISSQIMSHILNFVYRIVIGVKTRDISTDYRIYRTRDLKRVKLECKNFDVVEEVLLKLKLQKKDRKLRIGEVPIVFNKRMFGKSKRRLISFIVSYIKTVIKLLWLQISYATLD